MEKQRKPLSTKKPPVPVDDHVVIEDWMSNSIMPSIRPLVERMDALLHERLSDLHYAIKWGKVYYGTKELGWLIEVAAYHVSVNIVFLSGAEFNPAPPLGNDKRTRYIKLRTLEELNDPLIMDYIEQAGKVAGWK